MKKIQSIITTAGILILSVFMLLPFGYMLISSLQITYSQYRISFDVSKFTLHNYYAIFQLPSFNAWIRNSLFISIVGVIWTLLICTLAAYAFAKKGSRVMTEFILCFMQHYVFHFLLRWYHFGLW